MPPKRPMENPFSKGDAVSMVDRGTSSTVSSRHRPLVEIIPEKGSVIFVFYRATWVPWLAVG